MSPMIQFKQTILPPVIAIALVCFWLSPTLRAQLPSPVPDGGYPGENTAEGDQALFSLTTGLFNTAVGFGALASNTTGGDNTAVGQSALPHNTTGDDNTAIGLTALLGNTTGFFNTATGSSALRENLTGNANTANGAGALSGNTTGIGSNRPTVSPRARENADRQTDCLNGQHCLTVTNWFSYCDCTATVADCRSSARARA